MLNEELINLSNINDKTKEEEHRKNTELFKIRQDTSIAKPAKEKLLSEKLKKMLSKHDLLSRGLKINKNNALDFIIYKTGCATKQYQRKLKNMEQDLLTEVESTIEKIQEEEPDNLEDREKLKSQHKAV